ETVYVDPANLIDIRDVAPNENALLDSTEPRYAGNEPVIVPDPAADALLQEWDVDPPDVAMFRPNDLDSDYEEIVTLETGGSAAFLDRVEVHVHDNPSSRTGWISEGAGEGHPDVPPPIGAQGIRDYQVEAALNNGQIYFDFQGQTNPRAFPAGTTFDTAVDNGFFTQDDLDDSYIAFQLPLDANNFPIQATMWLAFTPTLAQTGAANVITDIAGNAMQPFSRYTSIERIPPEIAVTLAIADSDRIYLRFNEYVKGSGGAALAPGDFAIEDETGAATGITVTDVEVLRTDPDDPLAVIDVLLTLSAPLGRDDVLRYRVGPSAAGTIEDRFAAPIEADEDNRVTDIAMGVVEPTAAWNEIQRDDLYGDEFAGLLDASEFEGSGVLLDRTTTLQATILPVPSSPGANDALPLLLYYDVAPEEEYLTPDDYWVIEESEIVDDPQTQEVESVPRNDEARVLSPTLIDGPVREFVVPESDPEFEAGAEIEFMFSINGIPAARALDPNDPRSVDQWSFRLTPFVAQKAGVTILNNVIWPENGDKTMLSLDLERAGIITAQVFTLDGQIVDVLQRGRLAAGEHFLTWDGTNASGQIVASGLYFIRVVGPGIDEIRKVLVAK
ncbi:MAG: FlgD immunoglobulin-like domain containing protein, partial [Spirochaetota bacterium]